MFDNFVQILDVWMRNLPSLLAALCLANLQSSRSTNMLWIVAETHNYAMATSMSLFQKWWKRPPHRSRVRHFYKKFHMIFWQLKVKFYQWVSPLDFIILVSWNMVFRGWQLKLEIKPWVWFVTVKKYKKIFSAGDSNQNIVVVSIVPIACLLIISVGGTILVMKLKTCRQNGSLIREFNGYSWKINICVTRQVIPYSCIAALFKAPPPEPHTLEEPVEVLGETIGKELVRLVCELKFLRSLLVNLLKFKY